MKKLSVELEHCYGIRKLAFKFDFSSCHAVALYAPNGAMKSSFAKTFQDIANGQSSGDRIFPGRKSTRSVISDGGSELDPASVLVIRPYDEVFGHTEKTSTLLLNAALRQEYEQLHVQIDAAKELFLNAIRAQSKSKKNIENEISSTFTPSVDRFFTALLRIEEEILSQKELPYSDVDYDVIFDEKVLQLLGTKDFKTAIESYIKKYNELIDKSTYFKKGTFTYYNAGLVAKALADNGFFRAQHSISLNAGERREIASEKELEALVAEEKAGITNDLELRKKFAELEKLLTKNTTVRDFASYVEKHEGLLPALANIASFKEDIWKSYIGTHKELYFDVLAKYRAAEKRKAEIEHQASLERTDWEEVIEIFNARFFVPFVLDAQNRTAVLLGAEPILKLNFTFKDGSESATVERASLLEVLSTGEKKALYILNIIFEVQARLKGGQSTLIVVDDIADSFDYRNKYAIIQYLKDIAEQPNFRQIILTHNFDFFRTVQSRIVSYSSCFMVSKEAAGVEVRPAIGIKNIFVNDWKPNFSSDAKKRIACIPFMRNLLEFTTGESDPDYAKLTALLHWKSDTISLATADLFSIYNKLFGASEVSGSPKALVIDEILAEAENCLIAPGGANFENKVVLSMAIRLGAEKFMTVKIADQNLCDSIASNQTSALLREFKKRFGVERETIGVLDRVALMTPENIHLNSFMYEPILDMSDEHLRLLYAEVKSLA